MGFVGLSNPLSPSVLAETLREVSRYYQPSRVFFLFTNKPLDGELVDTLYCQQDSLFVPTPDNRQGDQSPMVVVLDSLGGDINAAYLITKLLRAHCSRLCVVVPRWAKSAATLVCLAADELVLTDVAELGPLDPQISHPGERQRRSALDEYMALDSLCKEALTTLDLMMRMMLKKTDMGVKDLLGPACTFVSNLMSPVFSRIDPFVHSARERTMDISMEYAVRVMQARRLSGKVAGRPRRPQEIAARMTVEYPSHAFIIDLPELQDLGLPARRTKEDEERVLRPLVRWSQQLDVVGMWDELEEVKREVAAGGEDLPSTGDVHDVQMAGEAEMNEQDDVNSRT